MVGRFGSPWLDMACAFWTANTYNMVQLKLKLKLKAKTKRRDPASAGMRWRLGDDALLRIRNTSLHSEMALRRRSDFVKTQHIYENTRDSNLNFEKYELRLWVS